MEQRRRRADSTATAPATGRTSASSLRSISGRIVERWVFNYRLPVHAALALLPAPWMRPIVTQGSAIWSYCPYVVDDLRLAGRVPIRRAPLVFAAGRLSVTDVRDPSASTLAWVPGRVGAHPLIGAVGRTVLRLPFGRVEASVDAHVDRRDAATAGVDSTARRIVVRDVAPRGAAHAASSGAARFDAIITDGDRDSDGDSGEHGVDGPGAGASSAFASAAAFESFFACRTSWAPAARPHSLTRLDLDAAATRWRRVAVARVTGADVPEGAVFDSAFHGVGGTYRWSTGPDVMLRS